jgi:hypothetical protein
METEKLTNEEAKRLLQKLKTDEKFQKDLVIGISIIINDRIEEDKRYAYYVIFTPLWKQLWHKITGTKPYKQHCYKPTF